MAGTVDQNSLIDSLRTYLRMEGRSPLFLAEQEEGKETPSTGFCFGLSCIWGYARWLNDQPPTGKPRDDMQFWQKSVETIAGWDKQTAPTPSQKEIFERFLQLIEGYQSLRFIESGMEQVHFEKFFF